MTNTIAHIKELGISTESDVRRVVSVGLCVLALLVSMYVYFVGKIVFDVVGRKTAEASIKTLQSHESELAAQYFSESKNLTIADAASVGLAIAPDTLYASRTALSDKTVGMAR